MHGADNAETLGLAIGKTQSKGFVITSGMRVVNIYLPNGNPVGSDNFRYKLAWMARPEAQMQT